MQGAKRPDLVRPYTPPPPIPQEELPPDYMALLSLLFGLLGLLLKYKICSWLALYACLSSVANVKKSEVDLKQIASSLIFALMGLSMNYFKHQRELPV
ncbi:hypothetical protein GUITHDRAFT_82283 [Guillardia theta CCMP2712]|uniref:Protein Asterix n=1 Tax=Guillardia theta (strain CCMP2712) TaxID=905079 RepID=L1I9E2_GUITC|nr:hypothetical protein GUITHDRAFT_82283 [Guillardia theta CCMP2712]EKX32475.1 hypothetical protein GUITHDRAFT_82283 [Guillardia theta CCMP2712]|eukprot:XP_005819455.1 hypothetical protein GUITHDRAFT_82283 [Guillardia theta CCMP2712]